MPVSLRDVISPSQILKSNVVTKISQTANSELPQFHARQRSCRYVKHKLCTVFTIKLSRVIFNALQVA
jgi:hypothetical protein